MRSFHILPCLWSVGCEINAEILVLIPQVLLTNIKIAWECAKLGKIHNLTNSENLQDVAPVYLNVGKPIPLIVCLYISVKM